MVQDTSLTLYNGTVSTTSTGDPIDVDGGTFGWVELRFTADASGTSPTLDAEFQVSVDGGTDYISIARFPRFVDAANKGDAGTWVALPVYIPRADANPQARGVNTKVKARLKFTAGGTSPVFTLRANLTHPSGIPYGSVAGFTSGVAGRYGPADAIKYWG